MRPTASRLLSGLLAALLLACLLAAAWIFPLPKVPLGIALTLYGGVLCWRPRLWLVLVPALLPVLDLAPWTGWFYLDELDLMLLATAAVGYARLVPGERGARVPSAFKLLFGLVILGTVISAAIGFLPWTAADANAIATYASPYNSLRIAKGTAWAVILLPLLLDAAGPDLAGLQRYLLPGMLAGLALTACAVIWERAVFPGLFNFASDYRPTAPFSAMHTGGAALDAYLAISFAFVAGNLLLARTLLQRAVAIVMFLLGCYAGLSLFSRDIYIAYGLTAVILGLFAFKQAARHAGPKASPGVIAGAMIVLALTSYILHRAFESGGYRLLGCALVSLGATLVLAGAPQRLQRSPARLLCGATAVGLCLLVLAATHFADKGPYLAFGASTLIFMAGALALWLRGAQQATGLLLALAAWPAMLLSAVLVGQHWGGFDAAIDGSVVAGLAVMALSAAWLLPARRVHLDQRGMMAALVCAIGFATVIPITSSYYLGTRFATTGNDLDVRLSHWREALGMMDSSVGTTLFGMGLGRFPAVYAWHNTHGEMPASMRYTRADGRTVLELGAPRYSIGYGEVLRVLQHVPVEAGHSYRFEADVRHQGEGGTLNMALCERWLLYPQNCVQIPNKPGAATGSWQHLDTVLVPAKPSASGLLAPPVQLELSIEGAGSSVMLTGLHLRDQISGEDILRNGDFSAGNAGWFFSSDRNHFPWHIKNVAVNSLFEQGWVGSASLLLLLVYLLGHLVGRSVNGDRSAAMYLAALASFLSAGLFDSLFDVPRLTLIFFLVASAAVLQAAPLRRKHSRSAPAPVQTASVA